MQKQNRWNYISNPVSPEVWNLFKYKKKKLEGFSRCALLYVANKIKPRVQRTNNWKLKK